MTTKTEQPLNFLISLIAVPVMFLSASPSQARPAGSVSTNDLAPAAPVTAPAPPDQTSEAISRSRALRRHLNHVGIAAVAPAGDPNANDDLLDYVRQIETLQLPRPKTQTLAANASPSQAPSVVSPVLPATPTPAAPRNEPNHLSRENLYTEKLNSLLGDPSSIIHALAAADALYKARDYKHAAAFYRIALQRMSAGENADPRQIAWTLFQIANCLRVEDPAGATAFYEQLVTQYPNSPWTPAAAVQRRVIAWCNIHRPNELLEKYAHDPNSL